MSQAHSQQASLRSETNLLPHFLDILECAQSNQSTQEINKKFVAFRAKVKQCRVAIEQVKGLEINADDQIETLHQHQRHLDQKKALLDKYNSLKTMSATLKQ